jgi:ABC-2 type transport system permease protein
MNTTVMQLTARSLLGRRRTLLLLALPTVLLALTALGRVLAGFDDGLAEELDSGFATLLLGGFGIAVLMPLLGLIAGTGAIAPEIDEGSIVYLLSKPLNRYSIIVSKLAVAAAVATCFGALPVWVSGIVLTGSAGGLAAAYAVGALVAGLAYVSFFLLLSVLTRNAVVLGLVYALVWESLLGGLAPGAQTLSIQQWSLSVVERLLGEDTATLLGVEAAVSLTVGVVFLLLVTIGCTAYAGRRLQTLRLTADA